ncbi:MAG: CBS domain-containing protein [Bacteroidota bacterium]
MTVQQLISPDIEPLAPTDTAGHAIYRLAELDVEHLPVVSGEGQLLALVSENEMLETGDLGTELGALVGLGVLSVTPEVHLFEAASLLSVHHLSVLPVAEEDGEYAGAVRRRVLFEELAGMLSTGTPGTILILEVSLRDYSLSVLSRLIEQSDAKVLSLATQGEGALEGGLIRVTIKLNVTDTARVRHVLEHHGYRVAAVFNEQDGDDELSLRAQEFMRYLEV